MDDQFDLLHGEFIAYLIAVTAATATFVVLFVGVTDIGEHINPFRSDLLEVVALFAVVGWLIAFVTAFVPFFLAMSIGSGRRVRHWSFFIVGASTTAAFAWYLLDQCIPNMLFDPEPEPTFWERYFRGLPYYLASGAVAGLTRHLIERREGKRHNPTVECSRGSRAP